METTDKSRSKVSSTSTHLIGGLRGILTCVAAVLAVGAATPGGAEDIGDVGGVPADVLDVEVGAYEGFGDIAYLCPLGNGCLSDLGGHIVRLDETVWGDLGIDTGDAFPDETDAIVRQTFFGHVIALAAPSPADIVCFSVPLHTPETGRRCARIFEVEETETPEEPNLGALNLTVARDTTSFCEPGIAYVIRMDTAPPPSSDGVEIGVCAGFDWVSADPADFMADEVSMAATMPLAAARTPGTTYDRSAYR